MLAPGMLGLHLPALLPPRGGILGARNGRCHSQGEPTPQVSGEGRTWSNPAVVSRNHFTDSLGAWAQRSAHQIEYVQLQVRHTQPRLACTGRESAG